MGAGPLRAESFAEPLEGACFGKPCCSAGEVPGAAVEERIETIRMDEKEDVAEVVKALEGLEMEVGFDVRAAAGIDDQEVEREPSITARVPEIDCLHSKAEPEPSRARTRSSTVDTSKSTLTKEERLDLNRYSKVDDDIIRGVPLRRSLKGMGRIWRYQPATWKPEQRAKLYDLSQKVVYFDVFLSHTWHTPGWQKLVALSFQCGWRGTLALWCVVEIAAVTLCLLDVYPMPLVYQASVTGFTDECPMGVWVWAFGALALLLGLLLTPYVPESFCCRSDVGFIDVASIHQQDPELMERGVYGIAGFLRVSAELRVLWSAPYLSRLWCIFELAAYRKVNPDGIIRFRPLFVERIALVSLVTTLGLGIVWVLARSGAGFQFVLYIAYAVLVLLGMIAIAFLRSNYREKHQLRRDLHQFDLNKVSCREEFDRKFIHAAISKWYGSKEAFTEFVRQDLRKDLEPRLAARVPMQYHLLVCAALICASLEFFLGLLKAGAPTQSILCFAFTILLGVDVFAVVFISIAANYLSDRFAARHFGCCDHVQTVLITVLLLCTFLAANALGLVAAASSLVHCILFAAACGAAAGCLYWLDKKAPLPDIGEAP